MSADQHSAARVRFICKRAAAPPSLHIVVLRPATQFLRRTVPLSATLRWAEQDGLQLEEGSHEEEHSATLGVSNPYAVTAGSIPYSPAPVLRATIAAGLAFTVTVTLKSLMPHMRTLGALYSGAALASPLMTAAMTATLKGIVSDVFAQLAVERRNKLDVVRTACFVAFNFISFSSDSLTRGNMEPCTRRSLARPPPSAPSPARCVRAISLLRACPQQSLPVTAYRDHR